MAGIHAEETLAGFLRNKRKRQSPILEIEWQAKKNSWIRSVDRLYTYVENLLLEPIDAGDISLRKIDTPVTEDLVGTYSIRVLEITVGTERVEFLPKGLTVIGASGRVDIRGERDSVTLLLNANDEWDVVVQRVPHFRTEPLNQESLKNALERVMLAT